MGIELRREGAIAVVVLDRPERRNALDDTMLAALRKAAIDLADRPPRLILVHGSGADFSVGLDRDPQNGLFGRLEPLIRRKDVFQVAELLRLERTVFEALSRIPAPVIAAIEGACRGIGLELALHADLRVVAADADLAMDHNAYGGMPDHGGLARLVRLVGRGPAADLVLTRRALTGEQAAAWGLAARAVPRGTAVDAARSLAAEILAGGPIAVQQSLLAIRAIDSAGDSQTGSIETEAAARVLNGGELLEYVRATAQGRKPGWS